MLQRVLREPLVHFLALAGLIFLAFRLLNTNPEATPDRIEIGASRIEQLAGLFAKTWQRPPTPQELKGLVDDYVKEEIYYREALALGLDKEDTVIRRRLRQKMEFLRDAEVEGLQPSDSELETYLKANPEKFRIEPQLAFQQIFVSRERHGDRTEEQARALLETLRAATETDPATVGDPSLLPPLLPATGAAAIGQTFGGTFAKTLETLPVGQWAGPVASSYGLHLVRVSERKDARMPELAEARAAVAREWALAKRKNLEEERLEALLKRYRVEIESPSQTGGAQ